MCVSSRQFDLIQKLFIDKFIVIVLEARAVSVCLLPGDFAALRGQAVFQGIFTLSRRAAAGEYDELYGKEQGQ